MTEGMSYLFVKRKDYDEVVEKLECLLDHATGGKLSKASYPFSTMASAVTDYINDCCYETVAEIKAEAIKEFAEKIDELLKRYAHLHKYADAARKSTEDYADGTPMEMVSVWEVLSLKKWGMVEYETMSELQGNIETIAKERLLSELEKDFRLLVKEMTEGV